MKRCLDCNAAMPSDPKGVATAQTPATCAVCRGAPKSVQEVEQDALEREIRANTLRTVPEAATAKAQGVAVPEGEDAETRAKATVKAEAKHAAAHRD